MNTVVFSPKSEAYMRNFDVDKPWHASLGKQDLSSDEMDILRKSRIPTTWVFENWEVQTNGRHKCMFHDLDLFVTVRLLEETSAALSLGKAFSQNTDVHWKIGKTPRLPKMGRQLIVWWIILYLYDDSMPPAYTRNFDADKPWHASLGKLRFSTHRKRDGRRGSNARHSDWKQPFTENLEDLETHVLAHPSERKISDSGNENQNFEEFLAKDAMRDPFHKQKSLMIRKESIIRSLSRICFGYIRNIPIRLFTKEKKTEILYFLWQMVQHNHQGGTTNSKNPLWDSNPPLEKTVSPENLVTIEKRFNLKKQKMTQKLGKTFWCIQGVFFFGHHFQRRIQLYVSKEESFPIPLKYIDFINSTHTDLDVTQENELMIIGMSMEKILLDSWTVVTRCTLLDETPPKGYKLSGWRLTKIQTTSRQDHVWLDTWTRNWKIRSKKQELIMYNRENNSNMPEVWGTIFDFVDPSDEE